MDREERVQVIAKVLAEHPRYDRSQGSRYPAVCEGCGVEGGARFAGMETLIAAHQKHQAEMIDAVLPAYDAMRDATWATCEGCGGPIFRRDAWSHEGGTPLRDHDARPRVGKEGGN